MFIEQGNPFATLSQSLGPLIRGIVDVRIAELAGGAPLQAPIPGVGVMIESIHTEYAVFHVGEKKPHTEGERPFVRSRIRRLVLATTAAKEGEETEPSQ